MLSLFIRYFFITFCAFYIYQKTTDRHSFELKMQAYFFFPVITTSLSIFISNSNILLRVFLMILISYFYVIFIENNRVNTSLVSLLVSYGLCYVFLTIGTIIACIIFLIFYKTASDIPYSITDLPIGILQTLVTYLALKSNRLKKGISTLTKNNQLLPGAIISVIFVSYIVFISLYRNNTTYPIRAVAIFLFLFISLLLLYYWRHRITQTYREKLRLANEKSLEDEISALKAEIKILQADNQHLKNIVHKDNKLVPAMEATVMDFLQSSGTLSAEELSARGNELSTALHEIAIQRKGILDSLSPNNCGLPTCGLHTVDGLLAYMEKRAREYNINYRVKMDDNIKDLISAAISEEDLRHLLSDLIENALIATRYSDSPGKISIHLGNLQNRFLLEISDSGIPFTPETYQHFGHEQHTTHTEDGGSGIGLMDIWKIKKKYRASLQIYEHQPSTDIFSKKISFVFDRKNHFLIQTYRDKELQSALTRGDAHVFPYDSE